MSLNGERLLFQAKWCSIHTDTSGVEFVRMSPEVLVVPLMDRDTVILIREPAPAFGDCVLLLPGGAIKPDEPALIAANRELREETGYRARRLVYLGELRPFPKYLTVTSRIFLGMDLVRAPLGGGDEPYDIRQERVPLAGFEALMQPAMLLDARTIAALYITRHRLAELT